ncbi:MAG: argininosuccinate lyase [Clostridiales bacterium]|nr:argininosuccinate lyase [Clostridiales bacterium]
MAKMWAGRFSKDIDSKVNDFNSSISFDQRMYKQDIQGSIAHCKMLAKVGILTSDEKEVITKELAQIADDIKNGNLEIDYTAEDIHMFVEQVLTDRIGSLGKKLHTARSRNDQVALDVRLYLRDEMKEILSMLKNLCEVMQKIAKENLDAVMPGYTHLQRAQPITFAHHICAYTQMILRDMDRIKDATKRMNLCPLGSGALATTTYDIDRYLTAELLGFDGIVQNSLDGVSDRDFCMEIASALSILMVHLSRLSEEIILWCSWEFKFVELDDSYATGSSIMPQKKNPDVAELIRGKCGRVIGDLTTLLTMMKNLPLAYNKDMQEDKEAIFDAIDTAKLCISTLAPMLDTMTVLKQNMYKAAQKGFINATDCADWLVKKGMPFRDAYKITGTLVAKCIEMNTVLEELDIKEYKKVCDLFDDDIYNAVNLVNCLNGRRVPGGPAPEQVEKQIEVITKILREY